MRELKGTLLNTHLKATGYVLTFNGEKYVTRKIHFSGHTATWYLWIEKFAKLLTRKKLTLMFPFSIRVYKTEAKSIKYIL